MITGYVKAATKAALENRDAHMDLKLKTTGLLVSRDLFAIMQFYLNN